MILLARLFVISPMIVIYCFHETHHGMLRDRVSSLKWFGATLICLGVIWVWDVARRPPRTLPSVILTRMLVTSMLVFSVVLLFGGGWYFWFMLSHSVVWLLVWLQLFAHRLGHHFIYPHDPSGNYFDVRRGLVGILSGTSFQRSSIPTPSSSEMAGCKSPTHSEQPPKFLDASIRDHRNLHEKQELQ